MLFHQKSFLHWEGSTGAVPLPAPPPWHRGAAPASLRDGMGQERRDLSPSQPALGWTRRAEERGALPTAPAQLCPAVVAPSSSSRLSPARLSADQPAPPAPIPAPSKPPITQGTIVEAANSGPEFSTAEHVNQRRDKDKQSKKGSLRALVRD